MESCICLICQKTDEPAFIRSRTTARLLGLLTSFRAIPSRSGVVGKEVFRCCMAVVSSCRPKHSGAGDGGVIPGAKTTRKRSGKAWSQDPALSHRRPDDGLRRYTRKEDLAFLWMLLLPKIQSKGRASSSSQFVNQ
jgi:hypothetical protein